MSKILIAPSILSADFSRLADEVRNAEAAGADWIHVDVMDGHFVPNISIGPLVAEAVRRTTDLPLDTHLMIAHPERYLGEFARAGVNSITVHVEACIHLHRVVQQIKELGLGAGVALNPATPLEAVKEILPFVDLVLVMSVNPGFGGQQYIPSSTDKLARLRMLLDESGLSHVHLEVDGGVTAETAPLVAAAGATVLVAGSAIYSKSGSVEANLQTLRNAAEAGGR